MSSSTVFEPGFGNSRQRADWYPVPGGWETTLVKSTDDKQAKWDLTDYLASGETVSSAAYTDSGVTSSGKSVSSPQVIFTVTGYGYTEVTATLSTGRQVTRRFYVVPVPPHSSYRSDYGE